ncbi:MAG: hypothetical protein IPL50_08365 [Chitinophagaceae bacterium]|nr:hypothetical protein [Chitinophagaceae bacterium]
MKYLNVTKKLAVIAVVSLIFMACKKPTVSTPMGDAGQTLVKILGGSDPATITQKAIDFVAIPTQFLAVEIRRDIPNEAELNKTMVVTVKDDTAAVTVANPAYLQLPAAWYTIQTDGVKTGGQGGTFTFTFLPGEFAKTIYITIPNATLLNPSSLYGLGFTVTSADAGGVLSTQKSAVVQIGAKNAYDGVYECTFTNYHPSLNAGYTGDVTEVHFVTSGASTCKLFWPDAGTYACPAILGGGFSYFGAQEPAYTVNPATQAVTVQNAYVGATTFYTMNASFNSHYDAPTKTFYVKWGYSYVVPGVFDAGCREWTQTLKYTGPR